MIVPAYGLTATERVLPRMALDFTAASLDSRVTITRALNTATRVNSSGLIETVNANLPRFDFSPTSVGTCRGLLIEESRANLVFSSGDLGNATYWIAQRATAVSASGTAPDGTNSATLATEDSTAGNDHLFARQNVTAAANATITKSVFLKNGATNGRRYAILSLLGATITEWVVAVVDLVSGVVTTTNNGAAGTYVSSSITPWYDGWWRCTLTGSVISADPQVRIQLSDTGTPASWASYGRYLYNGNGVSNLYGWGMNVEAGAFATSYIPTTTSVPITRNADIATMTGTNFSSWYNATVSGAAVVSAITKGGINSTLYVFDDTNSTQYANIASLATNFGGSTGTIAYSIRSNSVTTYSDVKASQTSNNTLFNTVFFFAANNFSSATNGGTPFTQTSGAVPAATNILRLGHHRDGTILNGWLVKFAYYSPPFISAQTQAFSK